MNDLKPQSLEEVSLFLSRSIRREVSVADDMILYIENPEDSTRKLLLLLLSRFSRV